MVFAKNQDLKVVRWCLNALARLGTPSGSSNYVEMAIKKYEEFPEIVAASVAALGRYCRKTPVLSGFPPLPGLMSWY